MYRQWRSMIAIGSSLTAVCGVLALVPTASAVVDRCGVSVDARPVIMTVHGFTGDPGAFSESGETGSMNDSIRMVDKVNLVDPFDYRDHNTKWVTDENIGPALAKQINCLSSASKEAGGDGKIIVVAHSMGGLALREALNQANPVYVKPEKVGLAIMLGTPHRGAPRANWCWVLPCLPFSSAANAMRVNSSELVKLPRLPHWVPLRAIAGNIKRSERGGTDGVVRVDSATDEYTTDYPGDGRVVINCSRVWPPWAAPSCRHEDLPKDTQIQASVIQALGEYLND